MEIVSGRKISMFQELENLLISRLGEEVVVTADRIEVGVSQKGDDIIGDRLEAFDRMSRSDGSGHEDKTRLLLSGRQDGGFGCRAGCQTIIHQDDRLSGEDRRSLRVEASLVALEPFFFLINDAGQLRADDLVSSNYCFIQHHHIPLSKGADGKFAMRGMPDFADNEHVQAQTEFTGDYSGDHDPAAGEAQNQVCPSLLLLEILAELQSGILPRSEHRVHHLSQGCQPVTSVPTVSPMTTRRKLCGRKRSKTMIGILLSMHSEKAVESMTLSCFCRASR